MLCITNNSIKHWSFVYTQLNVKIVIFQTIHFNISILFSSIWPTDKILSGATTPGQSRPRSNGNKEGTQHSPMLQHYWILTVRLFFVIIRTLNGGCLTFCRDAVSVFCSPSWLGHKCSEYTLHTQYIFMYLAPLPEPLYNNTIEYIYGHYLTLMIN